MAGRDELSVRAPTIHMTELLGELAMVEREIDRLERQIKALRPEAKHEELVHMESNPNKWETDCENEKAAFEIKALHFISRAIRGDYYKLTDFSINDKSKRLSCPNEINASREKGGKVFRPNGMFKRPSTPSRPRHQTPPRNRVVEVPSNAWPKVGHSEEDRMAPNKLSENIVNCLIFIFLRLLRTSRAPDPDKYGPTARSTNFSLSFRAPNSKPGKDSRQQDPYGIFESKDSIRRDIGPYKNLVRFTSASMDFNCIQNSGFLPLFQKLKVLMDGLEKVELRFLSHQQKLAFWINMYNACIMHGYLQYGLPSVSTSEKIINQAALNIAGHSINAWTIEHFILRKPSDTLEKQDFHSKEMIIHELYGLKTPDPNITFALCCGTRSSPAVKIYTTEGVAAELERSKLEYLQAAITVTSTKRIALPELVFRNMRDFRLDIGSLIEWLPAAGSLRKSIVDCFRGGKTTALVEMVPYDFEFQYLFVV